MKNKIAIIGSGALGTALAKVLVDAGSTNIMIYGIDEDEIAELSKGFNTKYFPNSIDFPKFNASTNIEEVLMDASFVVIAVPSVAMPVVFPQIVGTLNSEVLIVNGSKGFYPGTQQSLHEKMEELSKGHEFVRGVVSLIGPSHAEEIVLEMPTTISSVNKKYELCREVQELFSNEYFRIYTQTDVKGAEVGAAYKNVLAIASGMVDGLGFGINTVAALLTRGMAEMARFNKAMKGKKETIMGLTGLGDLIVTATSNLSRNYTFGKNMAIQGKKKALSSKATIEGLAALDVIYQIGKDKELELPIVNFLYQVVHGNLEPKDFIRNFWGRDLKAE